MAHMRVIVWQRVNAGNSTVSVLLGTTVIKFTSHGCSLANQNGGKPGTFHELGNEANVCAY